MLGKEFQKEIQPAQVEYDRLREENNRQPFKQQLVFADP
jgi:hypothetical protein